MDLRRLGYPSLIDLERKEWPFSCVDHVEVILSMVSSFWTPSSIRRSVLESRRDDDLVPIEISQDPPNAAYFLSNDGK